MRYLLDTNILIAAMKGLPAVQTRLRGLAAADLILSPVVLGELQSGAEKSRFVEKNRERLATLTARLELAPLDAACSQHYGHIRPHLEKTGTPIGANDLWIAAQARALGVTVVTDNVAEFSRVENLRVENWLR